MYTIKVNGKFLTSLGIIVEFDSYDDVYACIDNLDLTSKGSVEVYADGEFLEDV